MSENKIDPSLLSELKATTRITDDETAEVRELVLYIDEPFFRFREGQSIGVLVPGKDDLGSSYHKRKYTIVKGNQVSTGDGVELTILVRRCFYIDDFSGEEYPGRASNYLCDAKVGDSIIITGPYRSSFAIPDDKSSNIIMIGTGTGIAPFRAFIGHIYKEKNDWEGQVRLFYGAKTGLDLLYMNDKNNDLVNYYQEETFQAFNALTRRPLSGDEKALEHSLEENIKEAWDLIKNPDTYVFVAGLDNVAPSLDMVMIHASGSKEAWGTLKQKMKDEGRWSTLLYS
ncbi:MAG: oxidoreductase [gamma proteobacterium symbiont of Taylorina sp.]|nr:oxidoreductase [gamma proteobacterium symbiont of Taylorina sp.]